MLGKEQAVPTELVGPAQLDFTIQPHDAAATQYSCVDVRGRMVYKLVLTVIVVVVVFVEVPAVAVVLRRAGTARNGGITVSRSDLMRSSTFQEACCTKRQPELSRLCTSR